MTNETKTKNKISRELAQEQVDLLLEFYDIDVEFFPEESRPSVQAHIDGVLKGIMRGRLSVMNKDGDLVIVQRPTRKGKNVPESLAYAELEGKHKVEMSRCEDNGNYPRMYTLAGAMTKEGADVIKSLKGCDLGDAENLVNLFLIV
jgi:hypothetical protein